LRRRLRNIFKTNEVIGEAQDASEALSVAVPLNSPLRSSEGYTSKLFPYQSVDNGDRHQVKRIIVKPGQRLSLQKHYHRSEHWIVVRGAARVTVNEDIKTVHENESIYIPMGAVHRLENPGKILLELIEVQTGSYLGEDDIIRLEDDYRRQ
jgi:mannose-6-phosphate isomerase-like protein (cupin superfamily)